jgi:hypothetical protein
MFRGLFYAYFTTFDERFYDSALSDLLKAKQLAPTSGLLEHLIGSVYQRQAFWTKAASADISESVGYRDTTNSIALQHFVEAI